MNSNLTLSDFDYNLPSELIAQKPAHPRDHSRLLIYNRSTKQITDDYFYNLPHYLTPNTSIVVNNSKVDKARLLFESMEIFITKTINDKVVEAMVRPGKKFKKKQVIELTDGLSTTVDEILDDGQRILSFNTSLDDPKYEPYRFTPFPPYIKQDETLSNEYQTIYAKDGGSKAAPTAGLHFTGELIDRIKKNHPFLEATLHVGLGTFAPVKTDSIQNHIMHSEWYQIDTSTAKSLNKSTHITAVGTTSVRVLESAVNLSSENYKASMGETDIFITPGYRFKKVDDLITNFHLPKSTLLMLISAMIGLDEVKRIYAHAIKERYRFFSFGDAMLITG